MCKVLYCQLIKRDLKVCLRKKNPIILIAYLFIEERYLCEKYTIGKIMQF